MKTIAKNRLECSGNTKPAKEALKSLGWKWDAEKQCWYTMLVDAHAQRIADGDVEFFKGLGGHRKECQLRLNGVVVWTSKTFGVEATKTNSQPQPDPDGFGWNCDAAGNRVSTRHIPGSAPDDMI